MGTVAGQHHFSSWDFRVPAQTGETKLLFAARTTGVKNSSYSKTKKPPRQLHHFPCHCGQFFSGTSDMRRNPRRFCTKALRQARSPLPNSTAKCKTGKTPFHFASAEATPTGLAALSSLGAKFAGPAAIRWNQHHGWNNSCRLSPSAMAWLDPVRLVRPECWSSRR